MGEKWNIAIPPFNLVFLWKDSYGAGPNVYYSLKTKTKSGDFSKKVNGRVYHGFSSIQYPIRFSFITQYNQRI